jgi:hypothetical protein
MTAQWPAPAGLHTSSPQLPVEGRLPSFDGATEWLNSPGRPGRIKRRPVDARGAQAPADWADLRSAENYTGYQRTEGFASPGGVAGGKPRPGRAGHPTRFRVLINGQPPGAAHGADTDDEGNGTVTEPRLHQLIRQPGPITDATFEIAFADPGAQAYVFTVG